MNVPRKFDCNWHSRYFKSTNMGNKQNYDIELPFFSTQSSWILQQASRSSQGFSPGQPVQPTPQNFPYRIPTAKIQKTEKWERVNKITGEVSKHCECIGRYNYNSPQHKLCYIWPAIEEKKKASSDKTNSI